MNFINSRILKNKEKIKSFVIFNLPSEKSYELNTLIRTEFLIIKEHLEKERKQELLKMIKKLDWIENKYSDLYHRYENTPVSRDILKWESEVYNDNYELCAIIEKPCFTDNETEKESILQRKVV